MNDAIRLEISGLADLTLPELKAKYAMVIGEQTRCPNKTWLIRRITEALESGERSDSGSAPAHTAEESGASGSSDPACEAGSGDSSGLVAQLQERYLAVIGRPTGSSHVGYLRWKLRQAERGLVTTGPRRRRSPDEGPAIKVLPLRMAASVVRGIDDARERLGLPNRAELIRRALRHYLVSVGEGHVAGLLEATPLE